MVSPTTDRRLGLVGNTAYKAAATVVATANITLSGEQTIDGIAVVESNAANVPDRVLAIGQTDASENGLWDVSTGSWTRSKDANGNYDLANGSQVIVTRGTHAYEVYVLATANPITVDTTNQTWQASLSAGSLATLAASGGSALVGFLQAGTGAVLRTVQSKLQDFVHVKDFGAVCDGVTDDTAAIGLAVTAAVSLGLPLLISGTPLISSTITISSSMAIYFEGSPGNFSGQLPSSYLIKKSTMTTVGLLISGQSCTLVNGGVVGEVGNTGDNIQITGHSCRWEHAFSYRAGRDGIRIGEDGSSTPNTNHFVLTAPCSASNGRYGLHVHDNTAGSPNANAGLIVSPFLSNNTSHGLYANNSFGNTVISVLSESNTGKGIYLDEKCVGWVFIGGDVEQNTAAAGIAGSDVVLIASVTAAGGQKGSNQFFGTNLATPATDGGWMTGRGWIGFPGFGTASGPGTANGEGTATLTFAGTATPGTLTYNQQVGRWTKNGRRVTVDFDLSTTSGSSTTAGNLRISGLPFSGLSQSGGLSLSLVNSVTLPSTAYSGITGAINGTNIDLYAYGSGVAFSAIASTNLASASGRMAGSFTYLTADS